MHINFYLEMFIFILNTVANHHTVNEDDGYDDTHFGYYLVEGRRGH